MVKAWSPRFRRQSEAGRLFDLGLCRYPCCRFRAVATIMSVKTVIFLSLVLDLFGEQNLKCMCKSSLRRSIHYSAAAFPSNCRMVHTGELGYSTDPYTRR